MKNLILTALLSLFATSAHADWRNEIIYFIMIDRYADGDPVNNQDVDLENPLAFHGGDLRGVMQNLPDIADLGATAIWLTPIALQIDHPIDHEGTEFYPHHGYWAEDLTKIDPRYGTETDLKELVGAAHDLGIKVMLDVVYNHLGYGANMLQSHPDWFRTGADCGGDPVTECLAGLPDFRTENPEIARYVMEAQIGLAERTGLDGFRLDTFRHLSHKFWQQHRALVRERLGDDFFLLGEVWDADRFVAAPYFAKDEADALFDFSFRDRVNGFLRGVKRADQLGRYLDQRNDIPDAHMMVPFLSSHDMSMFLAMQRGDTRAMTIAATLLLTSQGAPVIVYGEEAGRRGGIWPDNRQDMLWQDRDAGLRAEFQALIDLRKQFPALAGPDYHVLHADAGLLIFQRGPDSIVLVNRDGQPLPEGAIPADFRMVYAGANSAAMIFVRN